jgi:hypothetical protein
VRAAPLPYDDLRGGKMKTEMNTVLQPTDDITWRNVEEEIVVLKLGTGEYFTFNDLGREIWLFLTEGNSISEIIQKIVDTYEVEKNQAAADVEKFTSGLLHQGLLTTLK